MEGIKESKELLVGVMELSIVVIKKASDGLQLSDAASIVSEILASDELKAKLMDAVGNVSAVGGEVKDMNMSEVVELVSVMIPYIPKILDALKKPEAAVAQ